MSICIILEISDFCMLMQMSVHISRYLQSMLTPFIPRDAMRKRGICQKCCTRYLYSYSSTTQVQISSTRTRTGGLYILVLVLVVKVCK